jgi:hypothetical protein
MAATSPNRVRDFCGLLWNAWVIGLRIVAMAAIATGNLDAGRTLHQPINIESGQAASTVLLDVVERCLHRSTFVPPAGLLNASELPIECGLVEVGTFDQDERSIVNAQSGTLVHFEAIQGTYCRVTVPAPWRDTPGPTWQFLAGMLRNQQKAFQGRPPKPPHQQRLPFAD